MPLSSTLRSKCQITVPLKIRKRLGLKAGDRMEFVVEGDRTVVRPAPSEENPFERFRGVAPLRKGMNAVNFWREMRGHERDEDDR